MLWLERGGVVAVLGYGCLSGETRGDDPRAGGSLRATLKLGLMPREPDMW